MVPGCLFTAARAAAMSFAARYALRFALGIVPGGVDDDGRSAGGGAISEKQIADLRSLMEETRTDEADFVEWLKVPSLREIQTGGFQRAVLALEAKRRKMGGAA